MSATLEENTLSSYFWNAPVINVPGKIFPVDIIGKSALLNQLPKCSQDEIEPFSGRVDLELIERAVFWCEIGT